MTSRHLLEPNDYFLSATNPTATADQRDLDALAIRIFQMPVVQQAKGQAARRWKTIVGRDMTPEALVRFDELAEEWAFNYVMRAVNSDANHPKVLGNVYGPPHEWFGMKVPGSRASGGDCPDNHYSLIPVDGYARFEVSGQRFDPAPGDAPIVLTGCISMIMNLGSLDWRDVKFSSDGSFIITLDPEPANGRPNHIQTTLEAGYLFIRACRADWRQVPNAFRVRRIDPPTAPPLTIDQMAGRAARYMVDDVPAMFWWMRVMDNFEVNTIASPFNVGAHGGVKTQEVLNARISIADDEAFIFTAGSADAPYRSVALYDHFYRTFDYWQRTSTMNNAQGVPNADGSTSYVISLQDPGVHNWLDPSGFHKLLLLHRWQGLSRNPTPEGRPWAKGELVKLKDLDKALPNGMKRVTPAERGQQLAERLESFKLRYVDR